MLVRENILHKLKADLEYRLQIYRAWAANLEGEADADSFACYYHYLKRKVGVRLAPADEARLLGKVAQARREDVSRAAMRNATACGLFDNMPDSFARWEAVKWGELACRALFSAYGVNGAELIEDLDLHLIIGPKALKTLPDKALQIYELAIAGQTLHEIGEATGCGRAMIYGCLYLFAKAA
jgi:hypothetical protein